MILHVGYAASRFSLGFGDMRPYRPREKPYYCQLRKTAEKNFSSEEFSRESRALSE